MEQHLLILVLIGAWFCPKFTIACILFHYDYDFWGAFVLLIALTQDED